MANQVKPQRGLELIRPYVPGMPIEQVQREYGLANVIKLASNENPLGASPKALAAIGPAIERLNYYPDTRCHHVRHALAEHLDVEPEQVIVSNGVDGLILQVCMAYLDEESEVIVSRSSFPVYDVFIHAMRAEMIKTPLKGFGLDLAAMAEAITGRTKLIFVCNPNNPTGTVVSAAEVDAFLERVPGHVLVVFDEAYRELVAADDFPETLQYVRNGRGNVLVMRTFSKVYGLAGIRLGYGVAVPDLMEPLYQIREWFTVNTLAQAAGIAALSDDAFLQETVAANHAGRIWLYREFARLGLTYVDSHTNFILVEIGRHAAAVCQGLLERGVIVRPCGGYDLSNCIRVSVGTPAQNARFIQALEETLARCGTEIQP
jgi:histidinol-phosphate aminotransferase